MSNNFLSTFATTIIFLLSLTACATADPLPVIDQLPTFTPPPRHTSTYDASENTAILDLAFATRLPPTAVVIQTTPSPLPPPTETPTPTPIVYAIQEGDTILGIAIDKFTTTDEILTRNPNLQPNLLSIGQEIILPPPATAVFSGDPTTPVPLNVTIRSIQSYITPVGSVWLIGEIHNDSSFFVEDVQLELSLIGQNGTDLGKTAVWTAFSLLAPQEQAPFAVLITEPPATIEQTQAAVINGRAFAQLDPENDSRILDLSVSESDFQSDENNVTITGLLQNNSPNTAEQTQLTATLYDQAGNVSGYGQLTVSDPIPSNGRVPFTLNLAPPGAPPASVSFHIQALRAP